MQRLAGHKGLSQEGLKLIACTSMLLDHIGAVLLPGWGLRSIGRLAFPIFCFLLSEGAHYTQNQWRYALRLGIGMILSELPFDLLFYGGWTWQHQSVMVTLFLAFLMTACMQRIKPVWGKLLAVIPFALAAELLSTDYGGFGVVLVAVFFLTREMPWKILFQATGTALLTQPLAVAAMIPVYFYSGRKVTHKRSIQWAFYLFYPVHLTLLWLITIL